MGAGHKAARTLCVARDDNRRVADAGKRVESSVFGFVRVEHRNARLHMVTFHGINGIANLHIVSDCACGGQHMGNAIMGDAVWAAHIGMAHHACDALHHKAGRIDLCFLHRALLSVCAGSCGNEIFSL